MFGLYRGPAWVRQKRFPVFGSTLMFIGLVLGGCSTAQQQHAAADVAIAPKMAQATSVEIEDDGLPSQSPPPVRVRAAPDDPSEPYSRNYGGSNPSAASSPSNERISNRDVATLHLPTRHSEPNSVPTSAVTTPDHETTDHATTDYVSTSDAPANIPADLPPMFRQKLVAAMTDNE